MHAKAIKPGDRFRKSDSVYSTVWVVTRVIRSPGVPTHFMLTDEDGRNEVRTISEPTLTDPAYYCPMPNPAPADPVPGPGGGPAQGPGQTRSEVVRTDLARAGEAGQAARGWPGDLGLGGLRAPGASRAR